MDGWMDDGDDDVVLMLLLNTSLAVRKARPLLHAQSLLELLPQTEVWPEFRAEVNLSSVLLFSDRT